MSNRFFCLNGFDLESCHNLDEENRLSPSPAGKPLPMTKFTKDYLADEEPFYMKSTVRLVQDYQISFQNGFMNEHREVFKNELEKYMEFARISLSKNEGKHLAKLELNENAFKSKMSAQELINFYTPDKSETLLNAFSLYDKLKEYLDIIAQNVPTQVALQLFQAAEEMVVAYKEMTDEFSSISDLLEISSNKIGTLKDSKLLNFSLLDLEKEVKIQAEKVYFKFMNVFCASCLLVIAQYFENPYFSEKGLQKLKRSLSPFSPDQDEEESLELSPSKKRKYSF